MLSAADLAGLSREALINRVLDLQAESNALSRQLRTSSRLSTGAGGGGRGSVSTMASTDASPGGDSITDTRNRLSSPSHHSQHTQQSAHADPTALGSSLKDGRRNSFSIASDSVVSPAAARLSTHRLEQHQARRTHYDISMSVMVIENGSALSVPMSAVLDKTYGRDDMRDADTPVVGAKFLRDMESLQTQRFSVGDTSLRVGGGADGSANNPNHLPSHGGEPSPGVNLDDDFADVANGGEEGSLSSASSSACRRMRGNAVNNNDNNDKTKSGISGRGSVLMVGARGAEVDDGDDDEPLPQDPSSTAAGTPARTGVSRLNLNMGLFFNRDISLDADAIISGQTLRMFNQQFARDTNILSPLSSYGNAVYHYVVKTFAVRNGCQHSPDDVEGFGRTLISLCSEVRHILQDEPRHGSMASPCYVFGDLHGNFRDLFYFMDNLISFQDLRYTPHRFMFLGDYVDRGEFSVEVIAYLFAMKVLAPHKVLLLRGNHEDTLVSGDIGGYGNTSFRAQCHSVFGAALGEELWHRASETFSYLPLTANIDGMIYCTHGGIPRYRGGVDDRLDILKSTDFPHMESFFQVPENESVQHQMFRQVGMDTCWADPAENESKLDKWGFGNNPRGTGVILFGSKAVDDFLDHFGFEYIFRAHQEKSDGLKLSKNARVFTIFSTSAYVGHQNGAGVVLVADGKIRLIVKNADSYDDFEEGEEDVDIGDDYVD